GRAARAAVPDRRPGTVPRRGRTDARAAPRRVRPPAQAMSGSVASLPVEPLPGLAVRALTASLPQPLASLPPQEWLAALLQAGAAAPMTSSDALRKAVRDVLRQRGYRPTGRGKPSSE